MSDRIDGNVIAGVEGKHAEKGKESKGIQLRPIIPPSLRFSRTAAGSRLAGSWFEMIDGR
jgi:hypothetical protein